MPRPLFGRVVDASERTELLRRSAGNVVVPLNPVLYNQYVRYPQDPVFFAYSEQLAIQTALATTQAQTDWSNGNPAAWDVRLKSITHTGDGSDTLYTSTKYYHCTFSFRIPDGPGSTIVAGVYSEAGAEYAFSRTDSTSGFFSYGGTSTQITVAPSDLITIRLVKDVLTLQVNGVDQGVLYDVVYPGEAGPYYAKVTSSALDSAQAITDYEFALVPIRWWQINGQFVGNWSLSKVGAAHTSTVPGSAVWLIPATSGTVTFTFARQSPTLRVGLTTNPGITGGAVEIDIAAKDGYIYIDGGEIESYVADAVITIQFGNGSCSVSQDGSHIATSSITSDSVYFYVDSTGANDGITGFSFTTVSVPYWRTVPPEFLDRWTVTQTTVSNNGLGTIIGTVASYPQSNTYMRFNANPDTGSGNLMYIGLIRDSNLGTGLDFQLTNEERMVVLDGVALLNIGVEGQKPYYRDARYELQTTPDNAIVRVSTSLGAFVTQKSISYSGNTSDVQYGAVSGENGYGQATGIRLCNSTVLDAAFQDVSHGWQAIGPDNVLYDWILSPSSAALVYPTGGYPNTIHSTLSLQYPYLEWTLSMDPTSTSSVDVALRGSLTDDYNTGYTRYARFEMDGASTLTVNLPESPPNPFTIQYEPGIGGFLEISDGFTLAGVLSNGTRVYEYSDTTQVTDTLYVSISSSVTGFSIENIIFNTDSSKAPVVAFWAAETGSLLTDWTLTSNSAVLSNLTGNIVSSIYTVTSNAYPYAEFLLNVIDQGDYYKFGFRNSATNAAVFEYEIVPATGGWTAVTKFEGGTLDTSPTLFDNLNGSTVFMELSDNLIYAGIISNGTILTSHSLEPQSVGFSVPSTPFELAFTIDNDSYVAHVGQGINSIIFNTDSSKAPVAPAFWEADAATAASLADWTLTSNSAQAGTFTAGGVVYTVSSYAYPYAECVISTDGDPIALSLKNYQTLDEIELNTAPVAGGTEITMLVSKLSVDVSTIPVGLNTLTAFLQISDSLIYTGIVSNGTIIYSYSSNGANNFVDPMVFRVFLDANSVVIGDGITGLIFNTDSSRAPVGAYWQAALVAGSPSSLADWTVTSNSAILSNGGASSSVFTTVSYAYPYAEFTVSGPIWGMFNTVSESTPALTFVITEPSPGTTNVFPQAGNPGTQVSFPTPLNFRCYMQLSSDTALFGCLSGSDVIYEYITPPGSYAPSSDNVFFGIQTSNANGGITGLIFNTDSSRAPLPQTWVASPTYSLTDWTLTSNSAILSNATPSAVTTVSSNAYPYVEYTLSYSLTNVLTTKFLNTGATILEVYYSEDRGRAQGAIAYDGATYTYEFPYSPGLTNFMQLSDAFLLVGTLSGTSSLGEIRVDIATPNSDPMNFEVIGETAGDGVYNILFNSDSSKNHLNYGGVWSARSGITNISTDWSFPGTGAYSATALESEIYSIQSYPVGTTLKLSGISGGDAGSQLFFRVGFIDYTLQGTQGVQFRNSLVTPGDAMRLLIGTNTYENICATTLELYITASSNAQIGNFYRTRGVDSVRSVVLFEDWGGSYNEQNLNVGILAFETCGISNVFPKLGGIAYFNQSLGWGDTWGWTVSGTETQFDLSYDTTLGTAVSNITYGLPFATNTYYYDTFTLSGNAFDTYGSTVGGEVTVIGFTTSENLTNGPYMTVSLVAGDGTFTLVGYDSAGTELGTFSNAGPGYAATSYSPMLFWYDGSFGFAVVDSAGAITEKNEFTLTNETYAFVGQRTSNINSFTISRNAVSTLPAAPTFSFLQTDNKDGNVGIVFSVVTSTPPPGWTLSDYTITNGTETINADSNFEYVVGGTTYPPQFQETSSFPTDFTYTLTTNYIDILGTPQSNVYSNTVSVPPAYPSPPFTVTPGATDSYEITVDTTPLSNWVSSWAINVDIPAGSSAYTLDSVEIADGSTTYDSTTTGVLSNTFTYPSGDKGFTVTYTVTAYFTDHTGTNSPKIFTLPGVVP